MVGRRRLLAGAAPEAPEAAFALLREVAGAGPMGPAEAWLEGEEGAVIATAHPYGETAVALGFSPAVSAGAARRLARGLLGELARRAGRIVTPEVLDEARVERALAAVRARLEPLVGPWRAEMVAREAWERALDGGPPDPGALRRLEAALRQMGWVDER